MNGDARSGFEAYTPVDAFAGTDAAFRALLNGEVDGVFFNDEFLEDTIRHCQVRFRAQCLDGI